MFEGFGDVVLLMSICTRTGRTFNGSPIGTSKGLDILIAVRWLLDECAENDQLNLEGNKRLKLVQGRRWCLNMPMHD